MLNRLRRFIRNFCLLIVFKAFFKPHMCSYLFRLLCRIACCNYYLNAVHRYFFCMRHATAQMCSIASAISFHIYDKGLFYTIWLKLIECSKKIEIAFLLNFIPTLRQVHFRSRDPTQQARNLKATLYQRQCDVMTSLRRWYDVYRRHMSAGKYSSPNISDI